MRLEQISATPHPAGHRIDLSWVHPDPATFPDLRLVRREGSHPVTPEPGSAREGVVVADTRPAPGRELLEADADGVFHAADRNLRGEVVYYYSIYPYSGEPPEFHVDRRNRAAALATAANDFAGRMYQLLPAIYHRYDTGLPRTGTEGLSEVDLERGQLRRFLDLPGGELDRLYSFARSLLDARDLEKVDGRLLPLLAEWIGWKTDFRLEVDAQRDEVRNAPALYRRIGILPVVAATVKRISDWESRPKEFVHNVFATTRPERLNLWLSRREGGGPWSHDHAPLSLDFAYHGRPAAARDGDGVLWLAYATHKRGRPRLRLKTFTPATGWAPSVPLGASETLDQHPALARQGTALWLFWESHDEADGSWRVRFRQRAGGEWSAAETLGGETSPDRRRPVAAADDAGGVWLFYQQRTATGWELRYNRHDGADWQLNEAATLPLDGGDDPRVESDAFVVVRPGVGGRRIWLFWARQEPLADPEQSRWSVVYRVKSGLDPANAGDWSTVRELPKADPGDHHREPAARVVAGGNLELFWASTRDGGWSVWRAVISVATGVPGAAEPVTEPPYSQRAPLALRVAEDTLLIQRSNRSVSYTSEVYGAMRTVDGRYAGSTTAAPRDTAKIALRGAFEDFSTYTYDAGAGGERGEDDWYARDTLGVYLTPDTEDLAEIESGSNRLRGILGEFMPATDRAVLIDDPPFGEQDG